LHGNSLQNRKAPSLSLPEVKEIFLSRLAKSWQADVFIGPTISTAMVVIIIIIIIIIIIN